MRLLGAGRSSRPISAGALEQARGLQQAALQVALRGDRSHRTHRAAAPARPGPGPPRRPRAPRDARRPSAPGPLRRRRRPPRSDLGSSAKARENSRSPTASARSRPDVPRPSAGPRRSGAASSTSSWTSVAMWTSSIAVAARIAPSPRLGPGAEQHQHRAQALAPGGERRPRVGAQRLAVALDELARAAPRPPPSGRAARRSAASRTTVTGGGTERFTRLVHAAFGARPPEWIAMIPPASSS